MENAQESAQTPDAPEQTGAGAVVEKVASVERRVQELVEAYAGVRRAKWTISCGILLVILVFGTLVYSLVATFDTERLLELMQRKAVAALPQTSASLRQALLKVAPVYQKEMTKRTEEALPVLQERSRKEFDTLTQNVQKTIKANLEAGLTASLKGQEAKLRKTFPSLKDDKKLNAVSKNLRDALEIVAVKLFADKLELCVDELTKVNETIQKFKPEGGPPAKGWFKHDITDVWTDFLSREVKTK